MTKRIEYIDAMRGFTMLLVVYSHILFFGYLIRDNETLSFNRFIVTFYMPLFFFISGFILFKKDIIWDSSNCWRFLKKKAKALLIPTAFFFIVYVFLFNFSFYDSLINDYKIGYWFTLALFEYFCVYTLIRYICHKLKRETGIDVLLLICALFLCGITPTSLQHLHCYNPVPCGILGVSQMKYFIFFILGTLTKKHFDKVQQILDNGKITAFGILFLFLMTCFVWHYECEQNPFCKYTYFFLSGGLGLMLVFAFFRKYQDSLTQKTKLGKILQYTGRRTLDIYLLHYFFLPRNLKPIGDFFINNVNPTLEFVFSTIIAIIVIGICLLMSNIIRISPILAHYLFGVKLEK